MSTLTLQPAEASAVDCYIGNGAAANSAFNDGNLLIGTLRVLGNDTYYRSLLRFDLSTLADGAIPSACELTITHSGGSPVNPSTQTAYRLTRTDWTEAATWNTYDGSNAWSTAGGDYTATGSDAYTYTGGTALTFDLLAMLLDAKNAGLSSLNVILIGPEVPGSSNYIVGESSADATASNRPKVVVTYDLSVHQQCANSVNTVIEGMDLPGLPSTSILVRKFPYHDVKTDPLPCVILSTHLPVPRRAATNLSDDITYPVTVNFFSGSNANNTLHQGRMLSWRERLAAKFHQKRLSNLDAGAPSTVWQCEVPASAPFDPAWFMGGNRDVSPLTLNFISRELRD